jgi:hypothetical protein
MYKVNDIIQITLEENLFDSKGIKRAFSKSKVQGLIVEVRTEYIYEKDKTIEEITYVLASNVIFVDGKPKKIYLPMRETYKEKTYLIIGKIENEEGER